jgi:hypothetical protein
MMFNDPANLMLIDVALPKFKAFHLPKRPRSGSKVKARQGLSRQGWAWQCSWSIILSRCDNSDL